MNKDTLLLTFWNVTMDRRNLSLGDGTCVTCAQIKDASHLKFLCLDTQERVCKSCYDAMLLHELDYGNNAPNPILGRKEVPNG